MVRGLKKDMEHIARNLAAIRENISAAAARAGRDPSAILLLAVSKTHPPETIRAARAAGCRHFGESRQQEAEEKIPLLPGDIEWHFIGKLQRNKTRKVLPRFPVIHSIDSPKLAAHVDAVATDLGLRPRVLLQVNLAAESSKSGLPPAELPAALDHLLALPRLHLEGLMAIPPFSPDPEATRPHFQKLRQLRDQLQDSRRVPLPHLSMGMSHDYPVAIEEGATIVRIGSALFGKRS